jgi:UDP-N-acetylglucosamine--N-acetylmuramyl-(pentapeptide) pyrophosphoryl-undecaprenol N-acetylglucosamine transferase
MADQIFAVVAGGGTAGHVLPALAVADSLRRSGHARESIHYVGARRGIEARLVPESGYDFTLFDVTGLPTRPSPRAMGTLIRLGRARSQAIGLLRRLQPRVVVSVGGYASLPAVLAAKRLGIPVVVVSYDAVPGRASRITARWAKVCAVAFVDSPLPHAVVTGAPVRAEVLEVDRVEQRGRARAELGIPADRFVVTVVGGSQGSGVINAAIWDLADGSADARDLAIYHVIGERFIDEVPGRWRDGSGRSGLWYRAVGYEPRMAQLYAASDLLVGRGGASTVHEVAVTGTPAILIPWSAAADDHQRANVASLSDRGGALVLDESELGSLGGLVSELQRDPVRLDELSDAAHRCGDIHRSGALAALIDSVALA